MATEAPLQVDDVQITRTVCARIPTDEGEFQLCHYANTRDHKEHLALVYGDVSGGEAVPVRVHSECFTGDVLGSRRCDCGDQLHYAMAHIAEAGRGVVIYLRQEGRGIGLEHKLQAYNLQDEGYDTVEANLLLGHQADEREYWAAAAILKDLGIGSVKLLTNNPTKIEHLRALGVRVVERVPVIVEVNDDNLAYLETKAQRMRHILTLADGSAGDGDAGDGRVVAREGTGAAANGHAWPHQGRRATPLGQLEALSKRIAAQRPDRPFVTLTYAQSLNGAIAGPAGAQAHLSGDASLRLTHQLRAAHAAILVGVGTVIADDPRLTVRLVEGRQPRPIIVDSHLRTPAAARLLGGAVTPIIATLAENEGTAQAQALVRAGATLLFLPSDAGGRVRLTALLDALAKRKISSVMVEGGAQIIEAFLAARSVDLLVVTVAPRLLAGVAPLASNSPAATGNSLPQLVDTTWTTAGDDLILWGTPVWEP